MTNVPDRPIRATNMADVEKAAEMHGWTVQKTTNLHITVPGKGDVLVETFDRDGNPYYYAETSAIAVGGDSGDIVECFEVDEVVAAVQAVAGR